MYLCRHAHSEEGERTDASRALTAEGWNDCRLIKDFLIRGGGYKVDVLFSSDYARSTETVQGIYGKKPKIPWFQIKELRPTSTPEAAYQRMAELYPYSDDTKLFIVTHNPLIQRMAAAVGFHLSPDFNAFAHGSVLRITTHKQPPPDKHPVHWQIRPDLLARFEEHDVAEAMIKVCESLDRVEKARIVDPLIDTLRRMLMQRFKRQAKAYKATKRIEKPAGFMDLYHQMMDTAYRSGVAHVQAALGHFEIAEAPRKKLKPIDTIGYDGSDDFEDDIDGTSEKLIDALIVAAIAAGKSPQKISDIVREKFGDWQGDRALTIATNEISRAFHIGGSDAARIINAEIRAAVRAGEPGAPEESDTGSYIQKAWSGEADACDEICMPAIEDGWIDEDILFVNGEYEPPGHPNCRCSIDYRRKE
jgi:phosphohistidine phosphatase SixA